MYIRVKKLFNSRTAWKDWPQTVKARYIKLNNLLHDFLITTEHVKFCWNLRGPTRKAKHLYRPIVNQYREGKVKSTPGGE
jgi:hypothetical protein